MTLNHVGQAAGTRDSYLIKSQTVKGDPVYRINDACDFKVGDHDPAVVLRVEDQGKWAWKPVTDPAQLQSFLAKATPQERSEQIGLWTDRRHWFHGKDGAVQDDEVQPIGNRWSAERFEFNDSTYDDKYAQNSGWSQNYSTVDAGKVSLEMRQTPGGSLPVLHEPASITHSAVEVTTIWALTGAGWCPGVTEHYTCTPGSVQDDGSTRHVI